MSSASREVLIAVQARRMSNDCFFLFFFPRLQISGAVDVFGSLRQRAMHAGKGEWGMLKGLLAKLSFFIKAFKTMFYVCVKDGSRLHVLITCDIESVGSFLSLLPGKSHSEFSEWCEMTSRGFQVSCFRSGVR